jgi:hypothetical protein
VAGNITCDAAACVAGANGRTPCDTDCVRDCVGVWVWECVSGSPAGDTDWAGDNTTGETERMSDLEGIFASEDGRFSGLSGSKSSART